MERNKKLKQLSRNLRKHLTEEESLLWYQFLSRYPLRFRRQYIIGNYIVDFYCHAAKLVVELDGSQHYEAEGKIEMPSELRFWKNKGYVSCDFPILMLKGLFTRFAMKSIA